MSVPQAISAPKADRGLFGFVRILGVGAIWLVIGAFAGRYLFPETVEKVVTQTVE